MQHAYAYSRLSSSEQRKGRGKTRQTDPVASLCRQRGYQLDETLDLHEELSAFRGANATHGKLKAFLDAVDEGRVKPGSVLIVESLDRLSRQEVSNALELFLGILRRGIEIVTLIPEPMHFTKNPDLTQLVIALVILSRAHEESLAKSKRHLYNWIEFRKTMRAGKPVGKICPKWLKPSDDGKRFVLRKDVVATIKRIFKLYLSGEGTHNIAEILNEERIPTLGHGKRWSSGQVRHVLTNRQLLGERQPHRKIDGKLVPEGDPIPDYFPQVIDDDPFFRVQAELKRRYSGKASRNKRCTNLFTNLICSQNGRGEDIDWIISGTKQHVTLAGPRKKPSGRKKRYHLPYDEVEFALLSALEELDVADLIAGANDALERLEAVRANRQSVVENIERTKQGVRERYSEALAEVLQDLENEAVRLKKAEETLELERRSASTDSLEDVRELIDRMRTYEGDDLLRLRLKLKSRIKQVVSRIRIREIVERSEQDRTVVFLIAFHHFERVRHVEATIKRSPTNRGNTVAVHNTCYEIDENVVIAAKRGNEQVAKALRIVGYERKFA